MHIWICMYLGMCIWIRLNWGPVFFSTLPRAPCFEVSPLKVKLPSLNFNMVVSPWLALFKGRFANPMQVEIWRTLVETSLMAQWLRFLLPKQGMWLPSPVEELSSHMPLGQKNQKQTNKQNIYIKQEALL